ncbi:MAG: hypothetical protein ACE5IP_10220 [Terriglobia bacterium]
MAETDIFPLVPDFPVARRVLPGVVEAIADSGRRFTRLKRAPRLLHQLELRVRSTLERAQLEEWYRRFENSWFSFHDPVFVVDPANGSFLERYFSVEFAAEPHYRLVANDAWDLRVELLDRIGAPLFSFPDPSAGHRSVFLEETTGVALVGAWTPAADPLAHGGSESSNPNTNSTDAFQWTYAGYGFRLWARRDAGLGIFDVLLDGTALATVDLFSTGPVGSQPVFTKLDVALGLHTIKLQATNTRNAAATGQLILADALEILI